MDASRRGNRVSYQQIKLLCEFLNSNRDIASSYNRSLQAKEYSRRKWRVITEILNSQGNGAHKDWKGWSKYWVDYKAKLKMKVAAVRSSHLRTGGGPSREKSLSEIELKYLQILGQDFGKGLPGELVQPFTKQPEIDSVVMDVENLQSVLKNSLIPTPNEHIQEPQPHHMDPMIQIPPDSVHIQTPHLSTLPAATTTNRSPRPRRLRHKTQGMSMEAARRSLINSSQIRSEAAMRSSEAMEKITEKLAELQNTAMQIKRILCVAFPIAAGQANSDQ